MFVRAIFPGHEIKASTIRGMGSTPLLLMIPAVGIGFLQWFGTIFVLNRFRGFRQLTQIDLISLLLFLLGGFGGWIAELCIVEEDLVALQVVASIYRTLVNVFGLLLIVNGRLVITVQQIISTCLSIATALLWEWQHRIIM